MKREETKEDGSIAASLTRTRALRAGLLVGLFSCVSCAPVRQENSAIALDLSALDSSLRGARASAPLCLAVAVSGAEVPFSAESENDGGFGLTSSFFTSDQGSVEMNVPIGTQRLFRVLALSGEACPTGQNAGNFLRSLSRLELCRSARSLHVLASSRVDVLGSQTLALTVQEPSGDGVLPSLQICAGVAPIAPRITELAAGTEHTCALNSVGKVFCWGSNLLGQLGSGSTSALETTPQEVSVPTETFATRLVSGSSHTCAVF